MTEVLSIPSVTGVDVNLRIAGPGARSFAFIIDWHIRLLAALTWLVAGSMVMFGALSTGDGLDQGFFWFVAVPALVLYFLYHPIVELIMAGRTPGKRIAGVRIVRADGALPGVGTILIRNVFRLVDSMPAFYVVGLTVTIFAARSQRIGDLAAGTLLVYDEPPEQALIGFSSGAVGRLGIETFEIIRDLLWRWNSIDYENRARLARQLLEKYDAVPERQMDADLREALEQLLADPGSKED